MSRCAWTATLLAFVAAGCLPTRPEESKVSHISASRPIPRTFSAVTPQQVTKDNARDLSTALWDEMDRAEASDLLPEDHSPKSATPKKK
ncbi:MAG: hypothetical protein FJ271_14500 [Planctomycetes bacterium]|nr:hypothetical protein [Planctomycetota bacterium]